MIFFNFAATQNLYHTTRSARMFDGSSIVRSPKGDFNIRISFTYYLLCLFGVVGGGPRVVVSTAAFHARVRGSVPGLGGLKETKKIVSPPSTCGSQYCGEPP